MTLDEMEDKCDKCKSYRKFNNLNMCIDVDECRHDDFKYFTETREPKNPRDCNIILMEGCILESRKDDESVIDVCNRCINFNKGGKKMTVEKKAEIYATENLPDGYTKLNYEKKEAYLAGFAEGKPKWHDLRKDPNDLPKLADKRFPWSITVSNQNGEACEYNYRLSHWQDCLFAEIDEPIAWCELPKFEEQEND